MGSANQTPISSWLWWLAIGLFVALFLGAATGFVLALVSADWRWLILTTVCSLILYLGLHE